MNEELSSFLTALSEDASLINEELFNGLTQYLRRKGKGLKKSFLIQLLRLSAEKKMWRSWSTSQYLRTLAQALNQIPTEEKLSKGHLYEMLLEVYTKRENGNRESEFAHLPYFLGAFSQEKQKEISAILRQELESEFDIEAFRISVDQGIFEPEDFHED